MNINETSVSLIIPLQIYDLIIVNVLIIKIKGILLRLKSPLPFFSVISMLVVYLTGCSPAPQSPPIASFTVSSCYTDTLSILEFDASGSTDKEDPSLALSFRWDWEHDGKWDTPFSRLPRYSHRYKANGVYQPTLELMDQDGMVDTCSMLIRITDVRKDSSIIDPRDGKVYRVALIEEVWWMAQNLDYGIQINSLQYPENNGIAEKFFYNDSDSIGRQYGGSSMRAIRFTGSGSRNPLSEPEMPWIWQRFTIPFILMTFLLRWSSDTHRINT